MQGGGERKQELINATHCFFARVVTLNKRAHHVLVCRDVQKPGYAGYGESGKGALRPSRVQYILLVVKTCFKVIKSAAGTRASPVDTPRYVQKKNNINSVRECSLMIA